MEGYKMSYLWKIEEDDEDFDGDDDGDDDGDW